MAIYFRIGTVSIDACWPVVGVTKPTKISILNQWTIFQRCWRWCNKNNEWAITFGYICVPDVSMLEILVVEALLSHVSHPRELLNADFNTPLFCWCSQAKQLVPGRRPTLSTACARFFHCNPRCLWPSHAVAYRLWPFCMFDLSECWLGLGVMCMRLASFCHSQEFFHHRQRELGKRCWWTGQL